MAFQSLRWFLLIASVMVQVGCASSDHPPVYDDTTDLQPTPSKDDGGHGWGTSVQSTGSGR